MTLLLLARQQVTPLQPDLLPGPAEPRVCLRAKARPRSLPRGRARRRTPTFTPPLKGLFGPKDLR